MSVSSFLYSVLTSFTSFSDSVWTSNRECGWTRTGNRRISDQTYMRGRSQLVKRISIGDPWRYMESYMTLKTVCFRARPVPAEILLRIVYHVFSILCNKPVLGVLSRLIAPQFSHSFLLPLSLNNRIIISILNSNGSILAVHILPKDLVGFPELILLLVSPIFYSFFPLHSPIISLQFLSSYFSNDPLNFLCISYVTT